MPYSGSEDASLPENVKKLNTQQRKKWVATFNNTIESCQKNGGKADKCEELAFRIANGTVKKEAGAMEEIKEKVKVEEPEKIKGGEGSGNFGHEGRPGEIGGSGERGSAPVTPLTTSRLNAGGSRGVTQGDVDKTNAYKKETMGKIDSIIATNGAKINTLPTEEQDNARQLISMMKEGRDSLSSGSASYFDTWHSDRLTSQMASNKETFPQQILMRSAQIAWDRRGGLK